MDVFNDSDFLKVITKDMMANFKPGDNSHFALVDPYTRNSNGTPWLRDEYAGFLGDDYDPEMAPINNQIPNLELSTDRELVPALIPPTFNKMAMIKTVVLSVMFVISFIGNSATLVKMCSLRRRKSTINTLILHLATADLFVTFFCNVTDAVWASTVQWYAGNYMCKILKFLQVFGLYLSTYIIVIIAVDRCMAILDPMSRNKAPQRVRLMIICAWTFSALFSLPQLYIFRVERGPFLEKFIQCVTYGAYTAQWQEPLYTCLSVILMFIIPLVVMVTAYLLIFCTIAKKSRDLQKEESELETSNKEMLSRGPVRGQLFRKAKEKSLRMTTLIVFAFICCWTPYYVVFIKFVFTGKVETKVTMWIFFCGMANSMVNPLIYGAFHACSYRKKKRRVKKAYSLQSPKDDKAFNHGNGQQNHDDRKCAVCPFLHKHCHAYPLQSVAPPYKTV